MTDIFTLTRRHLCTKIVVFRVRSGFESSMRNRSIKTSNRPELNRTLYSNQSTQTTLIALRNILSRQSERRNRSVWSAKSRDTLLVRKPNSVSKLPVSHRKFWLVVGYCSAQRLLTNYRRSIDDDEWRWCKRQSPIVVVISRSSTLYQWKKWTLTILIDRNDPLKIWNSQTLSSEDILIQSQMLSLLYMRHILNRCVI